MPEIDANKEWERLNTVYREMGDGELLELRAQFDDLTDVAQRVLRDELQKRNLWDDGHKDDRGNLHDMPSGAEAGEPWSNDDLLVGGETVCECETSVEAELYRYVLESAKIRSVVLHPGQKFYARLPLVKVAPDDLERAKAALAQPIPEDMVKDFEAFAAAGDFEVPACRKCGSTEVVLESVDPANEWLCDSCGARWHDAPSAD